MESHNIKNIRNITSSIFVNNINKSINIKKYYNMSLKQREHHGIGYLVDYPINNTQILGYRIVYANNNSGKLLRNTLSNQSFWTVK